ncbi:MAG: 50S ribosomal protein L17, partial [Gammaproteobacteria bacterium]|nr:50S ribosomal protein L17 [Gammaproteobacteria bacterium]MDA8030910.1 50S ribosomal protein L17 [Alphaproteobacteria bacterium]
GDAAPMAYVQLVGRDLGGDDGAGVAEKEAGKESEGKAGSGEKEGKKKAGKKAAGKSGEKDAKK